MTTRNSWIFIGGWTVFWMALIMSYQSRQKQQFNRPPIKPQMIRSLRNMDYTLPEQEQNEAEKSEVIFL